MAALLITFIPQRVVFDFGLIQVYWYGILMVIAILAGYVVTRYCARGILHDAELSDFVFYLIISSFVGARLWHVFVFQWGYYAQHIDEIIQIWKGGIAIQGAVLAGALYLLWYCYKKKKPFLALADMLVPGLALGQVIGRLGNFFNQELYGLPSTLPWAITIEESNRVPGYEQFSSFHPTFLYESLLNLVLFILLLLVYRRYKVRHGYTAALYGIGYGCIRFIVDTIRIDPMPFFGPFRLSQWVSIGFIGLGIAFALMARSDRDVLNIAKK